MQSPAISSSAIPAGDADETCDVCGLRTLIERRCKVLCLNCGAIVKSCADL